MPSETTKKLKAILKRLFTAKSIPAWVVTMFALIRPMYSVVDAVSNFDFVLTAKDNPRMMAVWHFLTSPTGNFLLLLIGLGWLTILALRQPKVDSTTAKNDALGDESSVGILAPCDKWRVGSRVAIRGFVFPEGSRVQLLIRPWNEAWFLHKDVEVNGCAWSYNYRFDKEQIPYEIMAVYGDSLKMPQYEELPPNVTKSPVITVRHDPNERDSIDCYDKQLHQTKIEDKHLIKKLVKTCFVRCEPHIDVPNDERQFVDFRFCILNFSLFNVSIESVLGDVTFIKMAFDEAIKLEGALRLERNERALNRGFRSEGWFTVRQYLPDYQVRAVSGAPKESLFYFHNLKITVTGEGFDPFDLDIPAQVQKGVPWNPQDFAAEFVFAGEAERQAKLRELEAERDSLNSQNENCEKTSNRYRAELDDLKIKNREQEKQLQQLAQCHVQFEIDAEASRVHVADVIRGCSIASDIRLRFENSAVVTRTIKTLRLTLHQTNTIGEVEKIESRSLNSHVFFPEDDLGPLTRKGFEPMQVKRVTLTHFYRFKVELVVESLTKSELVKKKHFLRMSMTAMEQPPFVVDIDVDWPMSSVYELGIAPEIREY